MLISPPFLPERGNLTEDAWLDAAMPACEHGTFPVSHQLSWHGGRHLATPLDSQGTALPVRAVADGVVVFVRQRTESEALTYAGGYTSDGAVVIRHDTEIGANAQNQPTAVRYYSVYMHLHSIDEAIRQGRPLYRKDRLGQAGHIRGQPNCLHFEICCDEDNLRRIVGRTSGDVPVDREGRTDALYGEAYFHLPAGTTVYAADPGAVPTPPASAQVLTRSAQDWFIGLRHERGNATLTTYVADGQVLATCPPEQGVEYDVYRRANALSQAVPAAQRAAGRANGTAPAPSACQELLRWGRVLGPDALNPADTPHWRLIATPAGRGWVNLNAANVHKFSDADFPQWRGWTLIDDTQDRDSRCDSQLIRRLLDAEGDGRLTLTEATARLREPAVLQRLDKTICKFPSEWDASTIDTRWGWLRQPSEESPRPMDEAAWGRFRAHAQALCLELPELFQAQWCFEPREFIRHMRRCGWRSASEFVQLVPSHAIRTARQNGQTVTLWEQINTDVTSNNSVAVRHRISLNRAMRIYGIDTPLRQAAFFGNSVQETGWLGGLAEVGGSNLWYAPWYGRGFLQLTNPGNYCDYWKWRGRSVPEALRTAMVNAYNTIYRQPAGQRTNALLRDANFPALTVQMQGWRMQVSGGNPQSPTADDLWAPSDSAGFYWVSTGMARHADGAHVLERCRAATNQGQRVYYRSPAFWRASAAINLPASVNNLYSRGLNGFDSRCCAYGVALAVLTEMRFADASGGAVLWYPDGYTRRRSNV